MYEDHDYNFGALKPLPEGYRVAWRECHEHYEAFTFDGEWSSGITCNPHDARRWAFEHAALSAEDKVRVTDQDWPEEEDDYGYDAQGSQG
jgi:hypothetical protein